jgi:CBS domain-containing protein
VVEDKKLVGILTESDIFRFVASELEYTPIDAADAD